MVLGTAAANASEAPPVWVWGFEGLKLESLGLGLRELWLRVLAVVIWRFRGCGFRMYGHVWTVFDTTFVIARLVAGGNAGDDSSVPMQRAGEREEQTPHLQSQKLRITPPPPFAHPLSALNSAKHIRGQNLDTEE